MLQSLPTLRADDILRHLATVTAAQTGTDFFVGLVREVATYLNIDDVFITERPDFHQAQILTLAAWKNGQMQPNSSYSLDDAAPCRTVFSTGHVTQLVLDYWREIVHTDTDSAAAMIERYYVGIPLIGSQHDTIGHLAVISQQAVDPTLIPVLQIFAARASAELERMRAEQKQAAMEDRYHQLFENSPQPILVFDVATLQYTTVNAAALDMYGYSQAEFLDMTALQLRPAGDSTRFQEALQSVIDGAQAYTGEWKHRRKDGVVLDVESHCSVFTFAGHTYMMSIIKDISARHALEEERHRAALEERNRLARELHDSVNQTLWSAALIADVLPELYQQDVTNGQRKLNQLRQLNRMALAEMRALLLELRPTAILEASITDLFQQLIDALLTPALLHVTLEIERNYVMSAELKLVLYRIAQEAFNNIVRHSEARNVQIALCQTETHWQLTIQDDGGGFDPSVGLEASGHLGLHIMRERAEQVNADLTIYSEPQCGTAIQIVWQE